MNLIFKKENLTKIDENNRIDSEELLKRKRYYGLCRYNNNCLNNAYFNLDGQLEKYCFTHKTDEMINMYPKTVNDKSQKGFQRSRISICQYENCNTHSCYNYSGTSKSRFCAKHKHDFMVNVKVNRCKSEFCDNPCSKKYREYCSHCFIHLFPDMIPSRNYKTKEYEIKQFVINTFPSYNWICDKTINKGSSRRRPDMLLELDNQIIIIEIDENQHMYYDCSCQNKRIMELSQDVNFRNIIFIRFNPDAYLDAHGNKIKSCWNVTQTGMLKVNEKELHDRLTVLRTQIEYWLLNSSSKMIETIELFYNQNAS
jgi:hypothetical protein